MGMKPAYGIRLGRIAPAPLCLAGLAACAAPAGDAAPMRMLVDGVPMKVHFQQGILDHAMTTELDPEIGRLVEMVPWSLVDGYAVTRDDGKPTSDADEDRARQAAVYFCESRGRMAPDPLRLGVAQDADAMIWYFGGCQ